MNRKIIQKIHLNSTMKKLIFLILVVYFSSELMAQEIVKFTANESANVSLGKEWDFQFIKMKHPLNVLFDGKILKLFYDDGKVYSEDTVVSFEKKEKSDYDKKTGEIYVLKIEENKMFLYIIIENRLVYDQWVQTIKMPHYSKNNEFISYTNYQHFED